MTKNEMIKNIFIALLVIGVVSCTEQGQKEKMISDKPQDLFPKESYTIRQFKDAEDNLCYISFNAAYKGYKYKNDYPFALFIDVETRDQNENGHPTPTEADVFEAFEEELVSKLSKQASFHYLGRSTLNGRREIFGYIDKPEKIDTYLRKLRDSGQAQRKFDYTIEKDEDWSQVSSLLQ
ncbi:DUF695 domain-containing protein [Rhodocytophaga aerolata]|uniref:DUF695 domain-containing protein n=1 Tax=Rhodocytophaga aerolata TaxID=455078 RepID=A0ABT8RJJ1_9BACT|nr:DUF695 domain-containing protein [Rhodocytophaga aerolata]MDO1451418.1 DUF695 domain-containing protein [Rhodocytophaga aerolata]